MVGGNNTLLWFVLLDGGTSKFNSSFVAMSHFDWPIKKKNETLEGFTKKEVSISTQEGSWVLLYSHRQQHQ